MFGSEHVLIAAGATGSPASDRHTEDSTQNAIPAASEEERRSEDSSGNATAVQHGVGHTGESSEAVPVSMRSSKPARGHQLQQQQQQQHNRPTSSVSEQGLNSAAGNNKSQLPGNKSGIACHCSFYFNFQFTPTGSDWGVDSVLTHQASWFESMNRHCLPLLHPSSCVEPDCCGSFCDKLQWCPFAS